MPFGITNAPAVFQTMIERVLGDIPGVSAYIDDVVVYSESKQEHLKTLEEVLKRMRAFNLKANVNKCEFGKREIEVFGFLVANGTVRPSPSRIEALSKMKKPSNPKETQSFLGMLNYYYRGFIPDFATSEAVLRDCIKNWRWTTACDVAYDRLMDLLAKLPTLHPNCGDAPLELHTDASQVAIAGVLMQVKNGQRLPIGYYSRMLKDAEQRYSTTEKELLAVHNSVLHFRPYLGYKRFTVHTDHKPLLGILRSSKTPFGPRWSKRLLQLAEFQYDVHYIRGKDNAVPDAISRAVNAIKVSWQSLAEAQQFDSEVQRLLENDPTVKIVDGEVYKTWPDGRKRLVLPQAFRLEALKDAHSTAHLGYKKTQHRLLNAFWWPGAGKDVAKFVGSCSTCLKKLYKGNVVERAEHLEIGATWETLALDHTGPFVVADGSKKWIVVLIDMFTKYVEAKVVPNAGADEVVKFLKSAFYRHGCPKSILADNAKTFVSKAVQQVFEQFGVKGKHTTPYNPTGNGIVERAIGTLKRRIKAIISKETEVELKIEEAVGIYNSSVHEATGYSPFFLMHMREKTTPLGSVFGNLGKLTVQQDATLKSMARNEALAKTKDAIANKQLKQDLRLAERGQVDGARTFLIGQRAWLVNPTTTGAFKDKASALVQVIARLKANVYMVKTDDGKELKVNVRRLIPYVPPRTPFQVEVTESEKEMEKQRKKENRKEQPRQYSGTFILPSFQGSNTQLSEESTAETATEREAMEEPGVVDGLAELERLSKEAAEEKKRTIAAAALQYFRSCDDEHPRGHGGARKHLKLVLESTKTSADQRRSALLKTITEPLKANETYQDRAARVAEAIREWKLDGDLEGREGM